MAIKARGEVYRGNIAQIEHQENLIKELIKLNIKMNMLVEGQVRRVFVNQLRLQRLFPQRDNLAVANCCNAISPGIPVLGGKAQFQATRRNSN